jgi:predicted amidohydrolase
LHRLRLAKSAPSLRFAQAAETAQGVVIQIKNSVAIISPSKTIDYYDKRALWGWDLDNYSPGTISNGIVIINGIKIGIRICFEIRFPEYFRELYKENVDIAIIQSNYNKRFETDSPIVTVFGAP